MSDPRSDIAAYLFRLMQECECRAPGWSDWGDLKCEKCTRTKEIREEVLSMGIMAYVHHDNLGPEWGKGEPPSEPIPTFREPEDHIELDVAYADGKKVWIEEPETHIDVTQIPAHVAAWVLSYYGEGGYAPGSFTQPLIRAMVAADPVNFYKLSREFPEIAAAIRTVAHEPGGVQRLRFLAHPHDLPVYIRAQIEDEEERRRAEKGS